MEKFLDAVLNRIAQSKPQWGAFQRIRPQGGGDINEAFHLQFQYAEAFLKKNRDQAFPRMFEMEASALRYLEAHSSFTIPRVEDEGVLEEESYLLLEWIAAGAEQAHSFPQLGRKLAQMHRHSDDFFGWEEDNYMGKLNQANSRHSSWPTFWAEERILPLWEKARNAGFFNQADGRKLDQFLAAAREEVPAEPPALVHGDLWVGNYLLASNGDPVLIDPAIHFGHREADLAMMDLFGGFPASVYQHYHESYPLESGWRERLSYHQLYPILVHLVLFGGPYESQARSIVKRYS